MAAADLREQRMSRWEQLRDDESGRLYFFFKVNSSDLLICAANMSHKCLACSSREDGNLNAAEMLKNGVSSASM